MKKRVIATSLMSVAMLASIATGATYALFTAEDTTNIAVTSGRVSIDAMVDQGSLKTYSLGNEQVNGGFQNGGTAKFDEKSNLSLNLLTPGDSATFNIKTVNYSNINIKYRIKMVAEGDLVPGLKLKAKIGEVEYNFIDSITNWTSLAANALIPDIQVSVELPLEAGNEYQEKTAKLSFVVEAVQGNADVLDPVTHVEGTNDYYVNSEDGMMFMKGIIEKTPHSKANKLNFFLTTDVDMEGYNWNALKLENINFDGQGHTISNLTVEGTDRVALFSQIYGSTVENVVLDGAEISGNHYVGGIVGYQLSGTVSNCEVKNSVIKATPNKVGDSFDNGDKVGGVVGLLYLGADATVRLEGCKVDNVEIHGYRDIGGVVGCGDAADISGVSASNVNIFVDQATNGYGEKAINSGYIVGRLTGTLDASNVVLGTNNISVKKAVAEDVKLDATITDAFAKNDNVALVLDKGTYTLPSNRTGSATIAISGTRETVIDLSLGAYMDNAKVSFEGVTIKGSLGYANGNGSDYAALYSHNVTYIDCHFNGGFRVGRDGAKFVNCTFDLTAESATGVNYVWTYGNDVTFEGCTFNTDGKAILVYSDGVGSDGISSVKVSGCTFNANAGAKAGAIANQNCAAIEVDNFGNGANVVTENNIVDEEFSGEWRIKSFYSGKKSVTINGKTYTSLALDGKLMTIDANKNVTVQG